MDIVFIFFFFAFLLEGSYCLFRKVDEEKIIFFGEVDVEKNTQHATLCFTLFWTPTLFIFLGPGKKWEKGVQEEQPVHKTFFKTNAVFVSS